MRYIFYADVYFIQNFMMKAAVLYLTAYCSKRDEVISTIRGVLRIVVVASLVTVFEICGLLLLNSYSLVLLFVNVIEIPCMLIGIMGKKKKQIIRLVVLGYFFTMIINGVLEALWNQFGERGSYIFYLVFSCGAVIVGVRIWRNYRQAQKGIFQVSLLHQGKKIQSNGFYDSGNRLRDPYTQRGVHIVSEQILFALIPAGDKEIIEGNADMSYGLKKPVYIPYQSLGNEAGMLEVYYIDELVIEGEKGRSVIQNCPVGVTKDNLFESRNYEIILNEEVF